MRTLEEYVDMIPTAPPDDIERYLDAMGRKPPGRQPRRKVG